MRNDGSLRIFSASAYPFFAATHGRNVGTPKLGEFSFYLSHYSTFAIAHTAQGLSNSPFRITALCRLIKLSL
jgi:hypothetical protein